MITSDIRDKIIEALDGIDKDELDGGYWETSTGVEFGKGVLNKVLDILDRETYGEEKINNK